MYSKIWYKNKQTRDRWNSLSDLERKCVNDEFNNILYGIRDKFTDPCKEPEEKCKRFCKNSMILEKHIHSNKKLKDLILYINHPTDVTVKGSQLQPFCYVGHGTDRFEQEVSKGSIPLSNNTDVYEFCTSSYQRITDIGICTTSSFKEVIMVKCKRILRVAFIKSKLIFFLFLYLRVYDI